MVLLTKVWNQFSQIFFVLLGNAYFYVVFPIINK